jgi:hypothetical protein
LSSIDTVSFWHFIKNLQPIVSSPSPQACLRNHR